MWDEFGKYRKRVEVSNSQWVPEDVQALVDDSVIYHTYNTDTTFYDPDEGDETDHNIKKPVVVKSKEPEYNIFRPLFAWLPMETIKKLGRTPHKMQEFL